MRYNKPQILNVTRATAAIKGSKAGVSTDNEQRITSPSYEDNE
ncbi:hypothetical protein [Edaphobacter dinghuensis]|uniref:Uncharacterized protein n=1 Tax=Edaphobacter dinghuensis TaxID=1560005 RepID=A0A917M9J7_9BACT|nr:hypothetical protein [Edaphobacter dinghuensis]GGG86428.1 hypothetical protein GCM10011585_32950 [Edaphobacter dinghuensis]